MRVDFNTKILGYDGKPAKMDNTEKAEEMTLGRLAIFALNYMTDKDREMKAEKKIHRGVLSQDIYNATKEGKDGIVDIPIEDVTMIKELIMPIWGPMVIMRVDEILDPKPGDAGEKSKGVK